METDKNKCPLCGENALITNSQDYFGDFISCNNCGKIIITDDAFNLVKKKFNENKFYACLYYYIQHFRKNGKVYLIVEKIEETNDKYFQLSIDEIMNLYPNSISEKIDMILLNISSLLKNPGFCCTLNEINTNNLFFTQNEREAYFLAETMEKESKFIKLEGTVSNHFNNIELTYKGWTRVDELKKDIKKYKKGFIAMWFNENMEPIRNAIKDVFVETGYQISIIDEKEHNNQIVQEILHEIETSDFIVADLTGNRGGVYYEAGYALGLGKEVILIVDNNWLEKNKENPHFDVAQKNQIRYISIDDLSVRLFNRITSTVGNLINPNSPLKSLKTNDE
ncbi:MAG: hypothetical protein EOL97_15235 [Spirochaetia bacterium]|nr:hypothetical protein [Spirochaetia bacterium]